MTNLELKVKWEKKFAGLKLADTLKEIGLDTPVMTQRLGADPYAIVYEGRVYLYMTGDLYEYDEEGNMTLEKVILSDELEILPYECFAGCKALKEINMPIYATQLTLGLIKNKLEEHKLVRGSQLKCVKAGDVITLGNSSGFASVIAKKLLNPSIPSTL